MLISIHALREEGDVPRAAAGRQSGISIHALREEGDDIRQIIGQVFGISIHALREEGDLSRIAGNAAVGLFLSTPSARRATVLPLLHDRTIRISIHALREEGDVVE